MSTKPTAVILWGTSAADIGAPDAAVQTDGLVVNQLLPARWWNYWKRGVYRWFDWMDQTFDDIGHAGSSNQLTFGNGRDGSVTVTTPITLTRDMFYTALTLGASGTVTTNGYRIFVKGATTFSSSSSVGALQCNGTIGGAPVTTTKGTAAAGQSSNTIGGSGLGTVGADGGAEGNPGVVGPSFSASALGGRGGQGGQGGTGAFVGGLAGTLTFTQQLIRGFSYFLFAPSAAPYLGGAAGTAGGSGCGSTAGTGTAGGASGGSASGGGVLMLITRSLVLGASTPAGVIQANGGAGVAGAAGPTNGSRRGSGGGGGGGGGGGAVYIFAGTITSPGIANAVQANGGAGGAGGSAVASGDSNGRGGNGGSGGNGGTILIMNMNANTISYLAPQTAGSAGGAPTGTPALTGGTGGAGAVAALTI